MNKRVVRFISIVMCAIVMLSLVGCANVCRNDESKQVTHLYLYGDMSGMSSKKDVRSIAAVFTQGEKQYSYHATIKVQGTSSLAYEKKNYTIKFFDDPAHENKSAVDVGWGAENEYCLKANWIDKTHSRNVVTAKLAAEVQQKYKVMEQAPCNGLIDGFPVEVYINDEFHGIYTWNIPKAAWMFGMDEENLDHIVMCGEGWKPAALFYDLPNSDMWSVEVGPENDETMAKFSRLSDFIMNSSDEEFVESFNEYLDIDAVLNYFILVEFAYLPDNCGKNMLVASYDGNIWYPSLYDLDTSWGTHYTGTELWDYKNELTKFSRNNLGRRVELLFAQELHDRYFELRKEILTKEHVLELFNEFDARISDDLKNREIERWGDQIPGYDISQIEEYLDSVIDRLDEKYENLVR